MEVTTFRHDSAGDPVDFRVRVFFGQLCPLFDHVELFSRWPCRGNARTKTKNGFNSPTPTHIKTKHRVRRISDAVKRLFNREKTIHMGRQRYSVALYRKSRLCKNLLHAMSRVFRLPHSSAFGGFHYAMWVLLPEAREKQQQQLLKIEQFS